MKIVIAGDYCPRYRVSTLVEKASYADLLGLVKPFIEASDYAIVNLECAVTDRSVTGIEKAGPCLSATEQSVDALAWAGFHCVTLANNHFGDFGNKGVSNTIDVLKSKRIDFVGGGNNCREAAEVLYKKVQGRTLAIINACEEEFSIATESKGGSNQLNPVAQYYSIQEARKLADFVIVIVHGGHEHYQLPSPRMKELYRFFIDAGADAVINHHQHCFSGYEVYKSKPIFYGIGNFCFDHESNRQSIWNEGYLVELNLDDSGVTFSLYPYLQCDDEAKVAPLKEAQASRFKQKIYELNAIIADGGLLRDHYNGFVDKQTRNYRYMFTPWGRRYPVALFNRGLLPFLTSRKKLIVLYDYLVCPSHKDNLICVLHKSLFNRNK